MPVPGEPKDKEIDPETIAPFRKLGAVHSGFVLGNEKFIGAEGISVSQGRREIDR